MPDYSKFRGRPSPQNVPLQKPTPHIEQYEAVANVAAMPAGVPHIPGVGGGGGNRMGFAGGAGRMAGRGAKAVAKAPFGKIGGTSIRISSATRIKFWVGATLLSMWSALLTEVMIHATFGATSVTALFVLAGFVVSAIFWYVESAAIKIVLQAHRVTLLMVGVLIAVEGADVYFNIKGSMLIFGAKSLDFNSNFDGSLLIFICGFCSAVLPELLAAFAKEEGER